MPCFLYIANSSPTIFAPILQSPIFLDTTLQKVLQWNDFLQASCALIYPLCQFSTGLFFNFIIITFNAVQLVRLRCCRTLRFFLWKKGRPERQHDNKLENSKSPASASLPFRVFLPLQLRALKLRLDCDRKINFMRFISFLRLILAFSWLGPQNFIILPNPRLIVLLF